MLGFNFSTKENEALMQEFIFELVVHQINTEVEEMTIQLRKQNKIKFPDAIIAATAITHKLTLITRNSSDFKSILKLETANPFNW